MKTSSFIAFAYGAHSVLLKRVEASILRLMASLRSGVLTLAYDDIRPAGNLNGTVVLVHGFATNRAENWKRLGWYGAFERKGYRVVSRDMRGHGESEKPHDVNVYGRDELIGDLVRLLDHLDLGRVELMG